MRTQTKLLPELKFVFFSQRRDLIVVLMDHPIMTRPGMYVWIVGSDPVELPEKCEAPGPTIDC